MIILGFACCRIDKKGIQFVLKSIVVDGTLLLKCKSLPLSSSNLNVGHQWAGQAHCMSGGADILLLRSANRVSRQEIAEVILRRQLPAHLPDACSL
jgi:hypothetical protein